MKTFDVFHKMLSFQVKLVMLSQKINFQTFTTTIFCQINPILQISLCMFFL